MYVNIQPPHVTEQCVKGLPKAEICAGTQGVLQMRAHSAARGYSPGEGIWQNADSQCTSDPGEARKEMLTTALVCARGLRRSFVDREHRQVVQQASLWGKLL